MAEPEQKLPSRIVSATGAALFVISAGMSFIWLIESYHREAVYAELLRLAAVAHIDAAYVDRIIASMHHSEIIATPLRAAAAVVFLSAIVSARAAWLIIGQQEEIDSQRTARWDAQRTLQERTLRLRENRQNLDRMQEIDGLTKISNRQVIEQAIEREWRRAGRVKGPISIIFIDVDGMTEYNDQCGHLAGDKYLQLLAAELKKLVGRPTDIVGRFEGDVFALVLGATDSDGARVLADACRRAAHTAIEQLDERPAFGLLTVSVATVSARPAVSTEPVTIVVEAKAGIADAKQAGGDSIATRTI